ncbi:MAG: nuclear transport factor 2 family protein [Blastocatellia bacterium]
MKTTALVLILLLSGLALSACDTSAQPPATAVATPRATPDLAKLSAAVTEKEKAVWEAIKNKQFDEARKAWADDYTGVYDTGMRTAAQDLADVRNLDVQSYEMKDVKVTIASKDTAVITYQAMMKGKAGKQDVSGAYNVASVWVEREGQWLTQMHTDMKAK